MSARYQSALCAGMFQDKVAVITGGGSGIGRCTAHELASLGATVIITGRTLEKLQRVSAEIITDGGVAYGYVCDHRQEAEVKAVVARIVAEHGRIDALVNNAGGQFPALLESLSLNGFDAVVRNNLHGTFLMMREVFTQSMRHHGGSIVNLTIDMWGGLPAMGHSGSARAAIDNLTKTAAVEWASAGVRVNAVAPGWIVSSGLNSYKETTVRTMMPAVTQKVPLQRMGSESEISALMCFLLSDAAAYITGTNIRIDGGASIGSPYFPLPDHDKSAPFQAFHRHEMPNIMAELEMVSSS